MLRAIVLALGGIAAAWGAVLAVTDTGSGLYLLCLGAVIILGTVFERWRYRKSPPPGARWERTGERFQDPATGETMDVEYDSASGERRYVRADDGASVR